MKSSWTQTSPTNLLVNGGFDADGTYAVGWTLSNATIAISSGACAVTATATNGRIYQTLSGLRPNFEYRVGITINGGANGRAGRLYTDGAAKEFDQTFTTTDNADVGGIFITDASGSAVTISLQVPTNGQTVTFDNAYVFTGNVQFAYSGNDLDKWRHHTDATKIDGADLYAATVANASLASLDTDTYNDSAAKVLGTDNDGGTRVDHIEIGNVTGAAEGEMAYSDDLRPYRGSTLYTGYAMVPLGAALTSGSWDGDAKAAGDSGVIDLSSNFGVPAGIKAVNVLMGARSTVAAREAKLGPGTASPNGLVVTAQVASVYNHGAGWVTCDSNGDVYFTATGDLSGVYLRIWGYAL